MIYGQENDPEIFSLNWITTVNAVFYYILRVMYSIDDDDREIDIIP